MKMNKFFTILQSIFILSINAAGVMVNRHNVFQDVTGMTQQNFEQNIPGNVRRVFSQGNNGCSFVENVVTGERWSAGSFQSITVEDLRNEFNELPARPARGTFTFIEGGDITQLQSNPANARAFFQIASNFDCLEGPGLDFTGYTYARAQGEIASVAAFPAALARGYLIPEQERNLLQDLPHFRLRASANGGNNFVFPRSRLGIEFDYQHVRVGIHADVDVLFGRMGSHGDRHQRVNVQPVTQIFTSALNVGINQLDRAGNMERVARAMLQASFEGTLLAAATRGTQPRIDGHRQQVFLTLMGCGVFHNRLEWVADVLEGLAHDIRVFNLDVNLVIFDPRASGMATFLPRMQALSERIAKRKPSGQNAFKRHASKKKVLNKPNNNKQNNEQVSLEKVSFYRQWANNMRDAVRAYFG